MTEGERWARLEQLFDEALDNPPVDVGAWLTDRCGDDHVLAEKLRRMLEAHNRPGVLDGSIPQLEEADLRDRLVRGLADRYQVGDVLGKGGMSTVYKAQELKHDRPVVLKVLQPGLAAAIAPQRFDDEVRIAAKLAHPHIIPLIDSGEVDGLRYYVMPFLGGTTLRQRIGDTGSSVSSALTFLRDIAEALAHAHDSGVVHRDLKPENILCVGGHAFLLDFGVAKLETSTGSTLTDPGFAIGTPGYMAPEQAAGIAVDHRADLYAWGLLARELATGSRDPSVRIPLRGELPPTLPALIEATLAIDPNERPASAHALVAALDGMTQSQNRVRLWPWVIGAAGVGAAAAFWLTRNPEPEVAGQQVAQPIAVAPLRDETGDPTLAGIGRLAGDWITQGLHEAGGARIVAWPASRAAVEASDGSDDAAALREATGAGTAVVGSVYLIGDSVRLQVSVVDTRRGIVIGAPQPITVARDSSTQGIRRLRQRVMGVLAVQQDDRLVEGAGFAASPPTYEAYRVFDQAMTAFDGYRYDEALDQMLHSWSLDTSFTASLVYAAYAAWNSSERELADSLLGEVALRRDALSDYYLSLAGFIRGRLDGDYPAAFAAANTAAELAPGSRAAYNAAQSLMALNRPGEALARLDSLDPNAGPMRGWPAYWSQRAYAAHLVGDYRREYSEAETSSERHPALRVAGVIKARALAAMGLVAELDSLLENHAGLPPDTYWSQGGMRVVAAEELVAHGNRDLGMKYFSEAVDWLEQRLLVDPSLSSHRYWLTSAFLGLGEWDAAEVSGSILFAADSTRLLYRGISATLAARHGDERRANELLKDLPAWGKGEQLVYRARVAAIEGRAEDAIELLLQALRVGVNGWHWQHGFSFRDFESLSSDVRFQRIMAAIPIPRTQD